MISGIFIHRPKLAIVISLLMVLAGTLCINQLPVAEYPEVAPPQVSVTAIYPGVSAEDMCDSVAAPIEAEMNGLEGLLYFKSTSSCSGRYELTVYFKYGYNSDIAQVNVQNAIKRAEPILPQEVKMYGVDVKKKSSDMLCVLSFEAEPGSMSIIELANYVRTHVKDNMARIEGVSDAELLSMEYYSMRIWLDPMKMSAMGISPAEINSAICSQNVQAAAGSVGIDGSNEYMQYKINTKGRLTTEEEFSNIIVRSDGQGSIVKLSDVSRVELGSESYSVWGKFNGKPSIPMVFYRTTEANALDTVEGIKSTVNELAQDFPACMSYRIAYDPTEFIRISLREIVQTLIEALILVVAVTYLFLQNWRATLIPAIAIPVSLLGTFPFLLLFGMNINTLTMFGLILVIGSLVDDAIVVVECVMTGIENGMTPKEATLHGMQQITGAVIATTLVTVAIYAPVAFYGGMVGQIYTQFAVAMCVALVLSSVNALTLSPALCVMLLRPTNPNKFSIMTPVFKPFNFVLGMFRGGFLRIVGLLVRRVGITFVLFALIVGGNYFFFKQIPSSFLPDEDKGAVLCNVELQPGSSMEQTGQVLDQLSAMFGEAEGVKSILAVDGFSMFGGMSENGGMFIIQLTNWDERKTPEMHAVELKNKFQAMANQIPQANIVCIVPPAIMGLGTGSGASFMLSADVNSTPVELSNETMKMMGVLNNREMYPETVMAFSTYNANMPQLRLDINREMAQMMNVPISSIFNTLQCKLASYYVNDFNLGGYTYKVQMQSLEDERRSRNDIQNILVSSSNGNMIPLSALADVKFETGPQTITRFNQTMSAEFTAQALPGTSSGAYMDHIEKAPIPEGYSIQWTDMSFQEKNNQGRIGLLLLLAVIFGYLFLVAQYESWTIPIPVLLSVLVATLGALLGLMITGMSLSIYAQLGLLMLIGLASKNAILMVEFSKVERENGKTIVEAALSGAEQRFRAVLMTAWSFILGVLPLLTATGAGAASRRAIGVPTFYGMLLATLVGIMFIPALYSMCQGTREIFQGWRRKRNKRYES